MEQAIELLNILIGLAGNITLEEAKSWIQAEENWEAVRKEGHEGDAT